jgi:hypothetical protein
MGSLALDCVVLMLWEAQSACLALHLYQRSWGFGVLSSGNKDPDLAVN